MDNLFEDNMIISENRPQQAVRLGEAIGGCFRRVCVGRDSRERSAELGVITGALAAGADVFHMGECLETELFKAGSISDCDVTVYIKDDPLIKLDIRCKGGLSLLQKQSDMLYSRLKEGSTEKCEHEGKLCDVSCVKRIYRQEIESIIPEKSRYSISICRSGQGGKRNIHYSGNSEELVISLSSDGTKASLYSQGSGFVTREELMFICCEELFEEKQEAALPFSFPCIADSYAEKKGSRVHRYYMGHGDGGDKYARELAAKQRFTLDGVYLAAKVLNYTEGLGISIAQMKKRIPNFYASKRFVELKEDKTKSLIKKFAKRITPDGAEFAGKNSRIVMQPSASWRGMWLKAEGMSMEAAAELCAAAEERIKRE